MSDLTFRKAIRAICDEGWIRLAPMYDRLPEPKPPRPYLSVELSTMHKLGQLERRGKPKQYEFRGGPTPITDLRKLRKGVKKEPSANLGFRELARLEQEDPAAYARIIARDPLAGGKRA